MVLGDASRLYQVLANLFQNASKFTPPGGKIILRIFAEETHLQVSVIDDGVGLSPSSTTSIFSAFDQGVQTGTGGLGLGLAIVKGLLDAHGADIKAVSGGIGHGAAFIFTIPHISKSGR